MALALNFFLELCQLEEEVLFSDTTRTVVAESTEEDKQVHDDDAVFLTDGCKYYWVNGYR